MALTVQVKGAKELADALKSLPVELREKIAGSATGSAAAIIRREAQLQAPTAITADLRADQPPPGTLQKSIQVRRVELDLGKCIYIVWVRHGKRYNRMRKGGENHDAFYWSFVEFGTRYQRAQPFMRPAFETKKYEALARLTDRVAKGLEKIGNEAGKRFRAA